MTFDEIVGAFAARDGEQAAFEAAGVQWDGMANRFRGLLRGYSQGLDDAEGTEQALHGVVALLAQHGDTASFADICLLGTDSDRLVSGLGEDGAHLTYAGALVSTFGGDATPLHRLIETAGGDDLARSDAIQVLSYLVFLRRIPEADAYGYLAGLPARLAFERSDMWLGYAMSVAALGFCGLSATVEALFSRDLIDTRAMVSAEFWQELRYTQQNGRDLTGERWSRFEPIADASQHLRLVEQSVEMSEAATDDWAIGPAPEPVRNALRTVGRNDPCPCGSGKKHKKCCLQADAD